MTRQELLTCALEFVGELSYLEVDLGIYTGMGEYLFRLEDKTVNFEKLYFCDDAEARK